MLPVTTPRVPSSIAVDTSTHGAGGAPALSALTEYLYRMVHYPQMDLDYTFYQMFHLCFSPSRAYVHAPSLVLVLSIDRSIDRCSISPIIDALCSTMARTTARWMATLVLLNRIIQQLPHNKIPQTYEAEAEAAAEAQ